MRTGTGVGDPADCGWLYAATSVQVNVGGNATVAGSTVDAHRPWHRLFAHPSAAAPSSAVRTSSGSVHLPPTCAKVVARHGNNGCAPGIATPPTGTGGTQ